MPLSPEAQKARRLRLKTEKEPPKRRRFRCRNCNKLTQQNLAGNKKFCSDECKEEHRRYGGSFGHMKDFLIKLIEKNAADRAKNWDARLTALEKSIGEEIAVAIATHKDLIADHGNKIGTALLAIEEARAESSSALARIAAIRIPKARVIAVAGTRQRRSNVKQVKPRNRKRR